MNVWGLGFGAPRWKLAPRTWTSAPPDVGDVLFVESGVNSTSTFECGVRLCSLLLLYYFHASLELSDAKVFNRICLYGVRLCACIVRFCACIVRLSWCGMRLSSCIVMRCSRIVSTNQPTNQPRQQATAQPSRVPDKQIGSEGSGGVGRGRSISINTKYHLDGRKR